MILARALGAALRGLLVSDPRVVLLGEDIADPYGGAFKVTRGLSTEFPDRVLSTPISEGAIAGVATGLALAGMRPVAEVMFGDFLGLCFDQIVNHAAKYGRMEGAGGACPVVVRCPSGGGRGYGPTHSQSLEKHFLGTPHLRVAALSPWHDPAEILAALVADDRPSILVEHKLLYAHEVSLPDGGRAGPFLAERSVSYGALPCVRISAVPRAACRATIAAYGWTAVTAAGVILRLAEEEELFAELVVPAQLAPADLTAIEDSVAATGALVTVEEGTSGWSWGTELAAEIGRRRFGRLRHAPVVVASDADVVPAAAELEAAMLTSADDVERAIREVCR